MFTVTTVEVSSYYSWSSWPSSRSTSALILAHNLCPRTVKWRRKGRGGDLSLSQGVVRMEPHTTKDPAKEDPASTQTRCGGTTHTLRVVPGSSMQLWGLISPDTSEWWGRMAVCQKDQRDLIMMVESYSIKACLTKRCRRHYKRVIFAHLYTHTWKGNVLVGTNAFSIYKNVCSSWVVDLSRGDEMVMLIYNNDYRVLKIKAIPSIRYPGLACTPLNASVDTKSR